MSEEEVRESQVEDQDSAAAGRFGEGGGGDSSSSAEAAEAGKVCAILAYLIPLVGIIWYFVDEKQKDNPFTTYHIKQALVALIIGIVVSVVSCGLLFFVPLVFAIIGLINAANGECKELPVIGQWGEQWFKF